MAAPFAALEARVNQSVFSRLANAQADFGGGLVPVIFDNAYAHGGVGPIGMAGTQPMATLKTADVPANPIGQTVTINAIAYAIAEHQPDGAGVSTLFLERAS